MQPEAIAPPSTPRALAYLAHCYDSRTEQLERLARRCRDVGLASRHVATLRQLASCYEDFSSVLWECAEELGVGARVAPPQAPISDRRIDAVLDEVLERDLPPAIAQRIRDAHARLSEQARIETEGDGPAAAPESWW